MAKKPKISKRVYGIIDKIANEHSGQRRTFGYLNSDDLKNEIWLICLSKLKDFDKRRGELEHFLRVLVKNRLVNRFKDITKSVRSPCPRCPFYDKGNSPSDCAKFGDDRYLCSKWRNYQLSVESRNSLINTTENQYEREMHENSLDRMIGKELKTAVLSKIDKFYHRDLEELMSGGKIPKQRVKRLKKEITRILEEIENDKAVQLTIKGESYAKSPA